MSEPSAAIYGPEEEPAFDPQPSPEISLLETPQGAAAEHFMNANALIQTLEQARSVLFVGMDKIPMHKSIASPTAKRMATLTLESLDAVIGVFKARTYDFMVCSDLNPAVAKGSETTEDAS